MGGIENTDYVMKIGCAHAHYFADGALFHTRVFLALAVNKIKQWFTVSD